MPIYDFQCTSCGFKQELLRKVSASAVESCPQCGKETFYKQVSAPSFQLSGSGWYATDFKGTASKAEPNAEEAAASPKCNPGCACH